MGILNGTSKKAFDYYWQSGRDNFFILSDIDSKFMSQHGFDGSVKDFKERVRNSKPFTRVRTGSAHYQFRSTPLYRIKDFKN